MPSKRSLDEALAVVAIGVQTPQDRFGKRQRRSDYEDDGVPAIAPWRCQLTGLSQTSNHYFVAYADRIFVYVPQYSTQALLRDPALIVTSQPSSPGLQGYLDRHNPHAINNLVVHFLGTEEAVFAVRDDGDVDAFLVRHIVQAIERRAETGNSIGIEADDVRPFFQANVGMSAWGLAVHSQARVIAVSANTHNITIFKFGLVGPSEDSDESDRESDTRDHAQGRDMDVTQSVLNGTSNIPHIAFCNTGDDPVARWLLTTDITGYCRSIDLVEMQATQTFRFGRPITYSSANDHDPINSGWFVGFLDRRSFFQEDSVHAALGMREGDMLPCASGSTAVWDIGATIANIPDTRSKFSIARSRRRRSSRSRSETFPSSGVQSPVTESEATEDSSMLDDPEAPQELEDDSELLAPEEPEDHEEVEESESGDSTYWFDDMDEEDEGTEDTIPFSAMYGGRRIYGNAPRSSQSYNRLCGDMPCPIMHASVRNVYLLQPGTEGSGSPFASPTIGFTNALHQQIQGQFAYLNAFERLNMHAHIPALGIIILASQKGRALVISLTKLRNRKAYYPPEMREQARSLPRTTYAMRLDRILPLASQEEAGCRPFAPLAGIAAGPMQGTEHLPDEQKRWRFMMYYADHTVLSYEISRRRARDSAVDIQGVVI